MAAIDLQADLQDEYDVVVVGCGPTGATLANLLGLCGLKVLVLEREPAIYPLPRAVHFDDETMRVFQLAGIADELVKKVRVNPGMRFVAPDGELLLDWPRPAGIGRHGWNTSYRLHQPDLEELLRAQLAKHPNVTLALGVELSAVQQHPAQVELVCQQVATRNSKTIRANYVVGCDGARSAIRTLMHSSYEDLGFRQRWLVVDVLLKREMPELGDHTLQFCDPVQPMTYCRNPGLRRRWEMALADEVSDTEALDPARIWALLARWITPADAELERKAIYTFRSAMADSWRNERLFIAGDAAHLTPPFMGQGMCAGIRDAANLAWKLALCLQRGEQAVVLDSYQAERSPHVREYISTAVELGRLISSVERGSGAVTMQSLQPVLSDERLVRYFGLAVTAHTGTLFGQPGLVDGRLMDAVGGYGFLLVVREGVSSGAGILSAAEHPELAVALDELGVNAVLLRPDRYILSTAVTEAEVGVLVTLASLPPFVGVRVGDGGRNRSVRHNF